MYRIQRTVLSILNRRQRGFILWEVVIGLAVFGIITGVGMKMWKIVDQGRFIKTCEQIQSIVTQLRHYRCIHGALPEEHALDNHDALSDASNKIWRTLSQDQWIEGVGSSKLRALCMYPKNTLGGGFGLIRARFNERSGIWMVIGKETQNGLDSALFTPKEAEQLAQTWGDGSPSSSEFLAQEGAGIAEGKCVEGGKFARHTQRSCIVYVFVIE
ncbi:type II secretion system protein [Holospora curviuscula]|uniref:Type II secretion system protein G n=1 Tax=Holospora curviuscula TaxID=1082868 RepID=A0A2S5R7Q6_9PROT|nr:type II secretion system protein [Holospora curviuscula]PPE03317.1 hypothetical protein HCUR_01241 [Holospora curviuscula]